MAATMAVSMVGSRVSSMAAMKAASMVDSKAVSMVGSMVVMMAAMKADSMVA